jgi:hypothetical protein
MGRLRPFFEAVPAVALSWLGPSRPAAMPTARFHAAGLCVAGTAKAARTPRERPKAKVPTAPSPGRAPTYSTKARLARVRARRKSSPRPNRTRKLARSPICSFYVLAALLHIGHASRDVGAIMPELIENKNRASLVLKNIIPSFRGIKSTHTITNGYLFHSGKTPVGRT